MQTDSSCKRNEVMVVLLDFHLEYLKAGRYRGQNPIQNVLHDAKATELTPPRLLSALLKLYERTRISDFLLSPIVERPNYGVE